MIKIAKEAKEQNNESFLMVPDTEEDSIQINESDIICINPDNYNSNIFFDNINAPVKSFNAAAAASIKQNQSSQGSCTLDFLGEYPYLKNLEKSESKKREKISKAKNSSDSKNFSYSNKNNDNKNSDSNINSENKEAQKLNFYSNTGDKNNIFNKMFADDAAAADTEKQELILHTHRNSDSRPQFNSSYLSNENFNFNFIESAKAQELKRFESRVKNNDSPPIIFGYVNILKNLLTKVNEINALEIYPNFEFLYAEVITGINIFLKALVVLLLVLFNLFLFKCDFFLRFNMYLILINDTKGAIEKGEIAIIIANIKRWFAFISVVILDELIKFLYLPLLVLHAWTCLMTIYLLLISGPESGVQFIIVSIYKFLRKLNLFY